MEVLEGKKERREGGVMRKVILFGAAFMLLSAGASLADTTDDASVDVLVTPIADVSLDPVEGRAEYDFGDVGLSTSSVTPVGDSVRLENTGQVPVLLTKKITNESVNEKPWFHNFTYEESSDSDTYRLWCLMTEAEPEDDVFGEGHQFTDEGDGYNELKLADGTTQAGLGVDGQENVWFRIYMPDSISESGGRSMEVTFMATGQ